MVVLYCFSTISTKVGRLERDNEIEGKWGLVNPDRDKCCEIECVTIPYSICIQHIYASFSVSYLQKLQIC